MHADSSPQQPCATAASSSWSMRRPRRERSGPYRSSASTGRTRSTSWAASPGRNSFLRNRARAEPESEVRDLPVARCREALEPLSQAVDSEQGRSRGARRRGDLRRARADARQSGAGGQRARQRALQPRLPAVADVLLHGRDGSDEGVALGSRTETTTTGVNRGGRGGRGESPIRLSSATSAVHALAEGRALNARSGPPRLPPPAPSRSRAPSAARSGVVARSAPPPPPRRRARRRA